MRALKRIFEALKMKIIVQAFASIYLAICSQSAYRSQLEIIENGERIMRTGQDNTDASTDRRQSVARFLRRLC